MRVQSKLMAISQLRPHPRNYNNHSDAQLESLGESLTRWGQFKNIVVDGEGRIIAGHGLVEAAKRQDIKEVEVKCYDHLSEQEITALLIADNELAKQAAPDYEMLDELLRELREDEVYVPGVDYDALLEELEAEEKKTKKRYDYSHESAIDEELNQKWKVKVGDIWKLGNHRIICGDSTDR